MPSLAGAGDLPAIKTSETNQVAECATPGRLMAYLKQRKTDLDSRYDGLATEYMRHGEALGVRWDYAFFQMLLETGYLNYGGDVKPDQNNFAGLGATGGGVHGESFKDIATGARAHIEHLLMYSGQHVDNPVAERTRNVQDWGVLTDWQKGVQRPINFTQLSKQWAPGSRRYASDISTIANRFFEGPCREPDPQPELVALAGGGTAKTASAEAPAKTASAEAPAKTRGLEAQKRSVDVAKAEGGASRSSLGAQEPESPLPAKGAAAVAAAASVAAPKAEAPAKQAEAPAKQVEAPAKKVEMTAAAAVPPVTLLNPAPTVETASVDSLPAKGAAEAPAKDKSAKTIEVAALPGGALKDAAKVEKKAPASSSKCRVWTASYGGSKAIIIKAVQEKTVNYTVLDVNEGSEKREADAYINAYAKGGQSIGDFSTQSQALEKAFELCPEG